MPAICAFHASSQRKLCANIFAERDAGLFLDAFLDARIRLKGNQAGMMGFAQIDPPFGDFNIPGIVRAIHQTADFFKANLARLILASKLRLALQEPFNFALVGKPA